jgi:CRISPR-associated protein Cas2
LRDKYLVAYDIREEKRLSRVFNKMKGYGEPIQYSVFICDLSLKEKVLMISALKEIINNREDSVIIIKIGSSDKIINDLIELIGKPPEIPERKSIII